MPYFFHLKIENDRLGNERLLTCRPKEFKLECDEPESLNAVVNAIVKDRESEDYLGERDFILDLRGKAGWCALFDFFELKDQKSKIKLFSNDGGQRADRISNIEFGLDKKNDALIILLNANEKVKQTSSETLYKKYSSSLSGNVDCLLENGTVLCKKDYLDRNEKLKVIVLLVNEDKVYYDTFLFSFFKIPSDDLHFSLVFDFGSDTTQLMRYYRKGDGISGSNTISVLDILKKDIYKVANNDDSYWQEVEKDMYASLFFLKSEVKEKGKHIFSGPNKENNLVELLTSKKDSSVFQNKLLLPNLKLMKLDQATIDTLFIPWSDSLNGNSNVPLGSVINDIQASLYCNFIHVLFKTLFRIKGTERILLDITLLMPNVYTQNDVNLILNYSNRTSNTIKDDFGISAVEFRAMSESDASFIGYVGRVQDNYLEENKPYLLIDSGKGTTDFSVLIKKEEGLESIFRGGIPGAGQLLSMGVLDGMSTIAGIDLSEIVSRDGDVAIQHKFATILDNIKKRIVFSDIPENIPEYHPNEKVILKTICEALSCFSDLNVTIHKKRRLGSLDEVIELLSRLLSRFNPNVITDSLKNKSKLLMRSYSNSLVNEIIKQVGLSRENQFFQIHLSGRAFLLDYYFEDIIKALVENKLVASEKDIIFDREEAKSDCLKVPLVREGSINGNSTIVGRIFFSPKGKNKNSENGIFRKLLSFKETENCIDIGEELFCKGIRITRNEYFNKAIHIGNTYYYPDSKLSSLKSNVNLVFNGEEYLFRTDNQVIRLLPDVLKNSSERFKEMSIISLFPSILFNSTSDYSMVYDRIVRFRRNFLSRIEMESIFLQKNSFNINASQVEPVKDKESSMPPSPPPPPYSRSDILKPDDNNNEQNISAPQTNIDIIEDLDEDSFF